MSQVFNYIGKSVFRHQNVCVCVCVCVCMGGGSAPEIFVLGELRTPSPYSAAYEVGHPN